MKKILVMTGSPRVNGNSDMLADSFVSGALEAGNEVKVFSAGRSRISGCKACDTCYSKGIPCSFDDDFNKLVPMMQWAEVLVIITPLYWYSFPAQLKGALDKMYSYIVGKKDMTIRESYLIVCGEIQDPAVFSGIIQSYQCIAEDRGWTDLGHYIIPGVVDKGDVCQTEAIKVVKNIGREF